MHYGWTVTSLDEIFEAGLLKWKQPCNKPSFKHPYTCWNRYWKRHNNVTRSKVVLLALALGQTGSVLVFNLILVKLNPHNLIYPCKYLRKKKGYFLYFTIWAHHRHRNVLIYDIVQSSNKNVCSIKYISVKRNMHHFLLWWGASPSIWVQDKYRNHWSTTYLKKGWMHFLPTTLKWIYLSKCKYLITQSNISLLHKPFAKITSHFYVSFWMRFRFIFYFLNISSFQIGPLQTFDILSFKILRGLLGKATVLL